MEVYIESVILNNFIMDYMLLLLSRRCLRLGVKRLRIVFSAFLGTVFAIITPLFSMNKAFTFIVKILQGALIVLFCGRFYSIKVYVRCFYLFLFFTFSFGGAVYGLFYLSGIRYDVFLRASDQAIHTVVLSVGFVVFVISDKMIKKLYVRKEVANFMRVCELEINGKKYKANGFLDSGNRLRYKNEPVIISSPDFSLKLKRGGALNGIIPHFVFVSTVVGKRIIPVYKFPKIKIYNGGCSNIIKNVMIGISEDENACGEFDLILGIMFA